MTRRSGSFKKGDNTHIEAWIANWPASTAASSKPGWEITSLVDSGDDFSSNVVITSTTGVVGDFEVHEPRVTTVMADTAVPPASAAMPTPNVALPPVEHGTIQSSDVPMSSLLPQATPSVAGSTGGLAYTAQYGAIIPQNMSASSRSSCI